MMLNKSNQKPLPGCFFSFITLFSLQSSFSHCSNCFLISSTSSLIFILGNFLGIIVLLEKGQFIKLIAYIARVESLCSVHLYIFDKLFDFRWFSSMNFCYLFTSSSMVWLMLNGVYTLFRNMGVFSCSTTCEWNRRWLFPKNTFGGGL